MMKKQLLKNIPPGVFFFVHLDYCFDTLPFCLSKSKNNSFKYQMFHFQIVWIFFKHLFLEVLVWTVETRFWQPCQKIYGIDQKFHSKTENAQPFFLASKKFLKMILWIRRLQLWKICFNVLLLVRDFWRKFWNWFKKTIFWNWFSSRIFLCTYKMLFCHTWPKFLQRKTKKSLILRKW